MPFFVATGPAEKPEPDQLDEAILVGNWAYGSREEAEPAAAKANEVRAAQGLPPARVVIVEADDLHQAMAQAHEELLGRPYPETPDLAREHMPPPLGTGLAVPSDGTTLYVAFPVYRDGKLVGLTWDMPTVQAGRPPLTAAEAAEVDVPVGEAFIRWQRADGSWDSRLYDFNAQASGVIEEQPERPGRIES